MTRRFPFALKEHVTIENGLSEKSARMMLRTRRKMALIPIYVSFSPIERIQNFSSSADRGEATLTPLCLTDLNMSLSACTVKASI